MSANPSVPKAASEPQNFHVHVCANPTSACEYRGYCECSCGARRESDGSWKLSRRTPASPVSGRLAFANDEMRCNQCDKQTPHRLFGDTWRCSECGGAASICAQPASGPVSGRNLTPEEQAAYTEFRKRHATKLSGPVSGETIAEIDDRYHTTECAKVPKIVEGFTYGNALPPAKCDCGFDALLAQLERLKADSLTAEERILILEMIEQAKVQSWANGTVLSDSYLNLRKKLRRISGNS